MARVLGGLTARDTNAPSETLRDNFEPGQLPGSKGLAKLFAENEKMGFLVNH
jgi:hypothetical protein